MATNWLKQNSIEASPDLQAEQYGEVGRAE